MIVDCPGLQQAEFQHKEFYGDDHYDRAVDQLVEECSELLKELMKERRDEESTAARSEAVFGEIVDVLVCLEFIGKHHKFKRDDIFKHVAKKCMKLDIKLTIENDKRRIVKNALKPT